MQFKGSAARRVFAKHAGRSRHARGAATQAHTRGCEAPASESDSSERAMHAELMLDARPAALQETSLKIRARGAASCASCSLT